MDKANQSVIFINVKKPELIFPASEIMLQTTKGAKIVPSSFDGVINYDLHCEDIYVLEIEPKNEEEKNKLKEFIARRKKTLKLWTAAGHIFNQNGRQDSIGYTHELKKLRISIPEYLQRRANLIELGNEEINDLGAVRILKAIAVQRVFDFNTGRSDGYLKLLGKMITEIVTEKHDPEIDALANMRLELIKFTAKQKHLLGLASLRDPAFRRREFGGVIVIDLREINPFLMDTHDFAKSIKAQKFIVEFSCAGYYRFLFIRNGEIIHRRYHAEISGKNKSRERAAKAFKKLEI
jgi:hypothetical protein